MKNTVAIILVLLFVYACSSKKQISQTAINKIENTVADSTEYDVEMFDSKFESWYLMYQTPSTYRQQSYYESWNRQYVTMWNSKANSSVGNFPFDPVIGYEPNMDYGFELNHKLFHYFMYVENVLKIRIMPGGPNFVMKEP